MIPLKMNVDSFPKYEPMVLVPVAKGELYKHEMMLLRKMLAKTGAFDKYLVEKAYQYKGNLERGNFSYGKYKRRWEQKMMAVFKSYDANVPVGFLVKRFGSMVISFRWTDTKDGWDFWRDVNSRMRLDAFMLYLARKEIYYVAN